MKKEELPQDDSALAKLTDELCYVKNDEGSYETALSKGWDVKKEALDHAWDEIAERIKFAKKEVKEGRKSPIFYYMEKHLMDVTILSAYVKLWKFRVKLHMKPYFFMRLSPKLLKRYADVFEISSEELLNYKGD